MGLPVRLAYAGPILACLLLASPGRADGPGPDASWEESRVSARPVRPDRAGQPEALRPARRVTGGPGYVGSDYGLGKPAFYGIGSRPDWGRSTVD
jgi:hypothetical protein